MLGRMSATIAELKASEGCDDAQAIKEITDRGGRATSAREATIRVRIGSLSVMPAGSPSCSRPWRLLPFSLRAGTCCGSTPISES
eukprot:1389694-Prymnesium_polylepis.1